MNLRLGLTAASIVPSVASAVIPTGDIPLWFRIALVLAGVILFILSFVPDSKE